MTNTKVTTAVKAATHNYIHDKCPDRIHTTTNMFLSLLRKFGQTVFHGGPDSIYPFMDALIETNAYDPMNDGAITTAVAPSDTDLLAAMHQEGWGYWALYEDISHATQAINTGSWANVERVIDIAKVKEDAIMGAIGANFDYNLALGDGATDNQIIGMNKMFDLTNANYLGLNFTSETTLRPKKVSITGNYAAMTEADMFAAHYELEEGDQAAQIWLSHPLLLQRLRAITENTVERVAGGATTIGHTKYDVLGADWYVTRRLSSTTPKIFLLNFNSHIRSGIMPKDKSPVDPGNYWLLEFAGPKPLGFTTIPWTDVSDQGFPGVLRRGAYGAFKLACTKPEAQAYIQFSV